MLWRQGLTLPIVERTMMRGPKVRARVRTRPKPQMGCTASRTSLCHRDGPGRRATESSGRPLESSALVRGKLGTLAGHSDLG